MTKKMFANLLDLNYITLHDGKVSLTPTGKAKLHELRTWHIWAANRNNT